MLRICLQGRVEGRGAKVLRDACVRYLGVIHRAAVCRGARHTDRGAVEVNLKSLGGIGSLLWRAQSPQLRYLDFSPIPLRRHGKLLNVRVCVEDGGGGACPTVF